jgi:hypothetical protein
MTDNSTNGAPERQTYWPSGDRTLGTNSRALGTNPRALARNKWALRNWKRQQRKKRGAPR